MMVRIGIKQPPDHALVRTLAPAMESPAARTQSRLFLAKALHDDPATQRDALAAYASLVADLRDDTAIKDERIFGQALEPALAIALKMASDGALPVELKPQAAALYGRWAQMVERARDPKVFSIPALPGADQRPRRHDLVLLAFDRAIELDPQADYFLGRGIARIRTGKITPATVSTLYELDIDPWRKLSQPLTPRAHVLLAQAKILEQRMPQVSYDEKERLLGEAIEHSRLAVEQAPDRDKPDMRIWEASANVELANYTRYDARARALLDRAVRSAQQSRDAYRLLSVEDRGSMLTHALLALGNAEEDYGWLLADTSHWGQARQAFVDGVEAEEERQGDPLEVSPVEAEARYALGRCLYKWSISGATVVTENPPEALREEAFKQLTQAVESGQLPPVLEAETRWWLGQVQMQQAIRDIDRQQANASAQIDARFKLAIEDFRRAAAVTVGAETESALYDLELARCLDEYAAFKEATTNKGSGREALEELLRLMGQTLAAGEPTITAADRFDALRMAVNARIALGQREEAAQEVDAAIASPPKALTGAEAARFTVLARGFRAEFNTRKGRENATPKPEQDIEAALELWSEANLRDRFLLADVLERRAAVHGWKAEQLLATAPAERGKVLAELRSGISKLSYAIDLRRRSQTTAGWRWDYLLKVKALAKPAVQLAERQQAAASKSKGSPEGGPSLADVKAEWVSLLDDAVARWQASRAWVAAEPLDWQGRRVLGTTDEEATLEAIAKIKEELSK